MKNQVILAAGLAVLSTSAFATKARMEALGQDADRGSNYIKDTRSVFKNPAHLNETKNYIVTEWGSRSNTAVDKTSAPHAEGGFFREMGSFAYGLYLGSEINAMNDVRSTAATGDSNFQMNDNGIDLFFAGDAGVQWGARLHVANGKDETGTFEKKHSAFGVGLGIVHGDLDVYTNLDLSDKSEGATASNDEWKADLGINVGAGYMFRGMKFYAEYNKTGYEYTNAGALNREQADSTIKVGLAKVHDVSSTARIFTSGEINITTNDTKKETDDTTLQGKTKTNSLPLTIGFEADATSWLALRGAVSQTLWSSVKNVAGKKSTSANTTNVSAGATLNFGKLKVDGMIGTDGTATDDTYPTSNGTLTLDKLMTRVGVHYWF